MKFLVAVIFSLLAGVFIESCPSEKDLKPCTCDWEGISCSWAVDDEDLYRSLLAVSSEHHYRAFWMQNSDVNRILNNTFARFTFVTINLNKNAIQHIEPAAFNGQANWTTFLDLSVNEIGDSSLPAILGAWFPKLRTLNLRENRITTIPDNAFQQLVALTSINLSKNLISRIGLWSFQQAGLRHLDLSENRLKTLGPLSIASHYPHTIQTLDVRYNEISSISPSAFEGKKHLLWVNFYNNSLTALPKDDFQNLVNILAVNTRARIQFAGNKIHCDRGLSWLMSYPDSVKSRLDGLQCFGKDIKDVQASDLLNF